MDRSVSLVCADDKVPVLRLPTQGLALCLLALAVANVPLQAVESAMVLSMLSLSQQSAAAGAGHGATLEVVATALGSARGWLHYTQLITVVSGIFVLCAALWRAALVPRMLVWLLVRGVKDDQWDDALALSCSQPP